MNQPNKTNSTSTIQDISWNLEDLYENSDALLQDLDRVELAAKKFAKQYRTKIASLEEKALEKAIEKMEDLQDQLGRAYTYAYLNWCINTEDTERGAFLHKIRERYSQIEQGLLFFDLEWTQIENKIAKEILKNTHLNPYKHYLNQSQADKLGIDFLMKFWELLAFNSTTKKSLYKKLYPSFTSLTEK